MSRATTLGRLAVPRWLHADTRAGRALRVLLLLAPLGIAGVLGVPVCLTAALLGMPCPGCGLSRAGMAMARGDWAAAIALHPLAPLVVPLAAAGLGVVAVRYVLWGRTDYRAWVPVVLMVLGAIMIGVWIARLLGAFGGPVPV